MDRNGYVFLNGRIVAAARASVSVFDRGLLYGDGLFETMRAYEGVVFALGEHLDRLERSARILGIPAPGYDWQSVIRDLLDRNRLLERDAAVRLTLTRGVGDPVPLPPDDPCPTTIIMARRINPDLEKQQRSGIRVTLLPFTRHGFLPEHKTLNYMTAVVGKVLAQRQAAQEGLFARGGRFLSEGTTSSLFVVLREQLCTAPLKNILPGVTRRHVIDLAEEIGLVVKERSLTVHDLRTAEEAFLASSVAEILPVVELNDELIGTGKAGPVTRRLQRSYRTAVRAFRKQRQGHS
jgi:branched-chain amino acid aminotransferase